VRLRLPIACRALVAGLLLSSLAQGLGGQALAQSALPLRGSLDAAASEQAEPLPAPEPGKLSVTSLEVQPVEPPPPRPRATRAPTDPYAPVGIGSTALKLYPSFTIGPAYSTNPNESGSDPEPDYGVRLVPRLRLESDWVRHALTAGFSADIINYNEMDEADRQTIDAYARLRLDVRRHTTADLEATYTADTPADSDAEEFTLEGTAALTQDFGPIAVTLKGGALRRTYGESENDGVTQSNDDRNYVQPIVSLRTSYALSEMLKPYIEAAYVPRYHDEVPDRDGYDRDSTGYDLAAGVEILSGPIWSGDVGLTYLHRNYADRQLDPVSTFGGTANLTWSPTELTRILLTAGTSIDESDTIDESGYPTWTLGFDLTHAVRDNVELAAGGSVEIQDKGSYSENTYEGNLGVAWKFNPILSWTAGYDFTWLDSGQPGSSYVEHVVSTGLTVSR
jgi:hypothetical protein